MTLCVQNRSSNILRTYVIAKLKQTIIQLGSTTQTRMPTLPLTNFKFINDSDGNLSSGVEEAQTLGGMTPVNWISPLDITEIRVNIRDNTLLHK